MPRAADFHDHIADADLPEAAGVMDEAAAFDAAVDMLDARTPAGDPPIHSFLLAREGPAPRLLRRHDQLHPVKREGQEAEILEQAAARRQQTASQFCLRQWGTKPTVLNAHNPADFNPSILTHRGPPPPRCPALVAY
jgi:hypothetical protein